MVALKAQWVVTAGLFPGQAEAEYERAWQYTSADFEADRPAAAGEGETVLGRMRREAHAYARELERGGLNWVNVEYLWI